MLIKAFSVIPIILLPPTAHFEYCKPQYDHREGREGGEAPGDDPHLLIVLIDGIVLAKKMT